MAESMGKRAAESSLSAPSPKRAAGTAALAADAAPAADATPAGAVAWSGAGDSLESTRQSLRVFAKAREWDQVCSAVSRVDTHAI